jgi:hypothetical protein
VKAVLPRPQISEKQAKRIEEKAAQKMVDIQNLHHGLRPRDSLKSRNNLETAFSNSSSASSGQLVLSSNEGQSLRGYVQEKQKYYSKYMNDRLSSRTSELHTPTISELENRVRPEVRTRNEQQQMESSRFPTKYFRDRRLEYS